ncbi:hypothetical protein PoB_004589100 [Plakobranchus ocellatus]|uniref:Uncharacterized protein n=1 Tax=Plakobranchus ocellatus TaxID=259542 RepID=A0AAV4BG18_9GAST|nr:hypothetical protein PoB_004589100 [Plakobranchus ocellatus]
MKNSSLAIRGENNPISDGTEQDTDGQSNRRRHCSILARSKFYPILMKILIDKPVLLSVRQTLLQLLGNPSMLHPLHEKQRLLAHSHSSKVSYYQGVPDGRGDEIIETNEAYLGKVMVVSGFIDSVVRNGEVRCPPINDFMSLPPISSEHFI